VIADVTAVPGASGARIQWRTDEPASSRVEIGLTTAYELPAAADAALVSDHWLAVGGLQPSRTYHYRVVSGDLSGNQATSQDYTLTTREDRSGLISDDFNTCILNSDVWSIFNPAGDGAVAVSGIGTEDAQLLLSVPSGTDHDVWTDGNQSVRAMQTVSNADFEIEVKFDSAVTRKFQLQGLLVEESPARYLRFNFQGGDTNPVLIAARLVNNVPTTEINRTIAEGTPQYIRVARHGETWIVSYSAGGGAWVTAGSFGYAMTPTAVGVFAGNAGQPAKGIPAPAHTAVVDYFFNNAAPIVPEDGDPSAALFKTLTVDTAGGGTVDIDPLKTTYLCGDVVTLRAVGAPGIAFSGWSGDATGSESPLILVMDRNRSVTATFYQDAQPPAITALTVTASAGDALVTWATDEPAVGWVDYGTNAAYGLVAEAAVLRQDQTVRLRGLVPGTTYHLRVTATDSAYNPIPSLQQGALLQHSYPVAFAGDSSGRSRMTAAERPSKLTARPFVSAASR